VRIAVETLSRKSLRQTGLVKTRISTKFQELPKMQQCWQWYKRNFVQCKTWMPSSSIGKVLCHQWLSRWLKVWRSRVQVQVKTRISGKFQELPEMQNASKKGTLQSAKLGCRVPQLATPWTYFLQLSLSSVILTDFSMGSPVHVLMLSIQAVHGLPCLRATLIAPCIISFSRQLNCFLRM